MDRKVDSMGASQDVRDKDGERKAEQTEAKVTWTVAPRTNMVFSWHEIAQGEEGTKEVPGSGNNPRIVEYHATTKLKATQDSVPWCSSFVNWCVEQAGYKGTDSAAARSWQGWGMECGEFRPNGSIVVMKRKGGGHVGFKVGEDAFYVYVLGGNQSDEVNVRKFAHTQVLSYRLPAELSDEDDVVYEFLFQHGVA